MITVAFSGLDYLCLDGSPGTFALATQRTIQFPRMGQARTAFHLTL